MASDARVSKAECLVCEWMHLSSIRRIKHRHIDSTAPSLIRERSPTHHPTFHISEMGLYPAYPILPPPMSLAHTAYPLVPLPFPSHSKMAISPPRVATAELPEPIEVILHRSAPAGGDGVRIALLHPLLDLTAAAPPDFSAATLLRGRRLQVEHTGVKSCCAPTTAAAATGVTRSWEKEKKELGVSKGM